MNSKVSVVIPTRNRLDSLLKVLSCLSKQTYPLAEVIIVDASDSKFDEGNIKPSFSSLNISYLASKPSVCIQRNLGIKLASAPYIFLCDDDIEFSEEYVSQLMHFIDKNNANAVSGIILQRDNGEWVYQYPPKSFSHFLFSYLFQHSVWGNIGGIKLNWVQKPFYQLVKKKYEKRGNTITRAGWPLIVDFSEPVFRTSFYGLGASIVKREWLINSPYDEVLDSHGIGDNYGVAMNFPEEMAIHVVAEVKAYHHQIMNNRLGAELTYYRRVLALHYFLIKGEKAKFSNRLWLIWSLLGNVLFHNSSNYRKATRAALRLIIFRRNPYWLAHLEGKKCVEPSISLTKDSNYQLFGEIPQ